MRLRKELKSEIKEFIIDEIFNKNSPYNAVKKYNISRQTISKYIRELILDEIITKKSKNEFLLNFYIKEEEEFENKNLEEDIIYLDLILKYEKGKKENVKRILNYAFTEMLNNAIDHSEGKKITISYLENYKEIFVIIADDGIGIFKKITRDHNLKNENEAIFELKKGKLTSDSQNHSGEGIFFTSKVVDFFSISSFDKKFSGGNENIIYTFEKNMIKEEVNGTKVFFVLNKNTDRTTSEVFKEYTNDSYIFDKTVITVHLAKEYLGQKFISRSEARRILSNTDKFKRIFLDFSGIDEIGQAFSDEIFRVHKNKNPDIEIRAINQNENVDFMIKRALNSK